MKRIIIYLTILLLTPNCVCANPISKAEAFKIARKIISQDDGKKIMPASSFSGRSNKTSGRRLPFPAYYIFNSTDDKGFVIVSGDDALPAVVGYSNKGSLTADGEIPEGLVDFLDAYSLLVEEVRSGRLEVPKRLYNGDITGQVAVAPLVTSTWSQEGPYNYYCPSGTPVGCVATAMTQIMYFWKYPDHSKGYISYNSSQGYLNVDFDADGDYDWGLMKDSYGNVEWKKPAGKMVAKLCYHAGVSCQMSYAAGGSGSYIPDAYDGYVTNFGYNGQTLSLYIRDCMSSKNAWNRLLYSELRAGRPVLYAGVSSAGGGSDAGGHAFVIDGYDTNAFVHVNWGWGGSYNGYFDLDLLDCARYQFSESQQMIVGIIPDPEESFTERKQFPMRMYTSFVRNSSDPVPVEEEFKFSVNQIYNISPYGTSYVIAIGLFDTNGNLLQDVSVSNDDNTVTLGSKYGYREYGTVSCKLKEVPDDGDYIFSVITKEKGYDDFVLPFTNGGDKCNCVHAYIHDGKIYFNQTSPGYVEPEEAPFEIDLTPAALPGDVNADGSVDINDVVCIINHMAGATLYDTADVNGDDKVDINDVVAVINIMAGT